MRTRLVIAMGLLLVAGCGAKGDDDHVLVSDVSETVGAGQCAPVEGPFAVPDGATTPRIIAIITATGMPAEAIAPTDVTAIAASPAAAAFM